MTENNHQTRTLSAEEILSLSGVPKKGDFGTFIDAKGVERTCRITSNPDSDPDLLTITYFRDGKKITGANIGKHEFKTE